VISLCYNEGDEKLDHSWLIIKVFLSKYTVGECRMTNTETNLASAITGEAKARLEYTAFAMQAMQEGHPEIAQLFLEAAGAETIHGISHLRVSGGVGSTMENLDEAANGEDYEIEEMYPRFVREAEQEGRSDAAASFKLALEREKHHRAMFKEAFAAFKASKA
jgi:rubrerythrin